VATKAFFKKIFGESQTKSLQKVFKNNVFSKSERLKNLENLILFCINN